MNLADHGISDPILRERNRIAKTKAFGKESERKPRSAAAATEMR
jgi:hypothetical protein